ncbi:MAG TPA: Crp/Fnr family transcriptional regulator [Azospirillum sp.]|nr:Crp/Fnr family transcriptional regulator [Azospirillum sp.]
MDTSPFRQTADALDALARVRPFDALPPLRLHALAASLTVASAPKGTVIFTRDATPSLFYVALHGVVALEAVARDGHTVLVEMVATPGPLDVAATLAGMPYPVQAVVQQPACVLALPVAAVRALALHEPAFAAALFAVMARQHRGTVEQISDLKVMTTVERLGAYLLEQAGHVTPGKDGIVQMRLPIAKHQIASKIGVVPESLSRAFTGLKRIGVMTSGRDVLITNLDRLRAFCANGDEARCAG